MPSLVTSDLDAKQKTFLESHGIRDFQEKLCFLSADKLKALFHHDSSGSVYLQVLLYNLIWQAFTEIKSGKRDPIKGNIRKFWYSDVKTPLARLGLFQKEFTLLEEVDDDEDLLSREARVSTAFYLYDQMTKAFDDFVVHRIFRFIDFGFMDEYGYLRFIGTSRPTIIFAAEKRGFLPFSQELHRDFGITTTCLGGQPKLLSTEYFTDDLKESISSKDVLILACVDYDPSGLIIAEQFQKQLSFFGVQASNDIQLITKDILTPEEIENYKYPLPANSETRKKINDDWVKKTGGINGEPYGFESDVVPDERIRERVKSALSKN